MTNSLIQLGQAGYLDAVIEIGFGVNLWTVQREIVRDLGRPRAQEAVPSCNSSGKTHLAGNLALAFYYTWPDAQVLTFSAREDQLRDNLWGEIRKAWAHRTIDIPGNLSPSGMKLESGERLLRGMSPAEGEGAKGYHSPHVLIIVDEGAFVDDRMASAIQTLLASGDARLVVIFNPTDDGTWASEICHRPNFKVVKIPAWKTPHLSHFTRDEILKRWPGAKPSEDHVPTFETIPPGASLITPEYLDDLAMSGRGPGSFDWETSVEANFWSHGIDTLVPFEWYDRNRRQTVDSSRPVIFGVDMAAYGDSESVVAVRQGNSLIDMHVVSGYRIDNFWYEIVQPLVKKYDPQFVVFDADGPGAGAYTDVEAIAGKRAFPFRGSFPISIGYLNMRAYHYWSLRNRFEWNDINIAFDDSSLRRQVCAITYTRREGKVRVTNKHEMRKQGLKHIDRADALMYAFSTDPATPPKEISGIPAGLAGAAASDADFWTRSKTKLRNRHRSRSRLV